MQRIFILALIVLSLLLFTGFQTQSNKKQNCDCQNTGEILKDIEKFKVGMTREDLMKTFSRDGGISPINPQRFVYKKCNFVKVKIKFEFIDKNSSFPKDISKDKIIEISKPYLEYPFID